MLELCANYEAFFGQGTKLTVLETGRSPEKPKVTVFPPSDNEPNERIKGQTIYKTLVCLARDFYPDHVSVSWSVNGESRTRRISTDSTAKYNGTFYTISSRFTVPEDEWTNPSNCFTCTINFYDGTNTVPYTDEICGIQGSIQEEDGSSREKYLKITHNAKLSYTVFIVKSVVYGLFVVFLLWKIQRMNAKQT